MAGLTWEVVLPDVEATGADVFGAELAGLLPAAAVTTQAFPLMVVLQENA